MILFSDFKRKNEKTKGKSPSGPATLLTNTEREGGFERQEADGKKSTYQLKESNSTKFFRRAIARRNVNSDDLLRELFGSQILYYLLNKKEDVSVDAPAPERAPNVELVAKSPLYGDDASQVLIASRYLNDTGERKGKYWAGFSLDDIMEKRVDGVRGKGRHALIVDKDADGVPNGLPLDKEFEIEVEKGKRIKVKVSKEQMYDLLAAASIIGNDDVNPGNFILCINKTPDKNGVYQCDLATIDAGHALLGLRAALGENGGPKIGKGRGTVLDGFNRPTLNDLQPASKIRRDFKCGLFTDAAFAASLRRTAENFQKELEGNGAVLKGLAHVQGELLTILSKNRESIEADYLRNSSRKMEPEWNKACAREIFNRLSNDEKQKLGDPRDASFVQNVKEKYYEAFNKLFNEKRDVFTNDLTQKIKEEPLVSKISDAVGQSNQLKDELGNSLRTVNHRIGKSPSRGNKGGMFNDELLDNTIENIKEFINENAEEMKSVANLIEIQSIVDKAAKGEIKGEALKEAQERIHELYKEDEKYLAGKSPSRGVVEWVRTDDDKKPFKGTLEEYINHRRTQLKELAAEKEKKSTSESLIEGVEKLEKQRGLWARRGAMAGAGIGAIVGSVVPGLGTVAGGLLGGIVGGLAMYVLPELVKAGVGIVNFLRDAVNHFRDKKTEPDTPVLEKEKKPEITPEESRSNLKSLRKVVTTHYSPDRVPNNKERGNEKNKTPGH